MQIVWDQQAVKRLQDTHTLLELETFDVGGSTVKTYCVVPAEKIVFDLASIDRYKELHQGFIQALNNNADKLCEDIAEHLMGKFGGELDSFYQEILTRIKK